MVFKASTPPGWRHREPLHLHLDMFVPRGPRPSNAVATPGAGHDSGLVPAGDDLSGDLDLRVAKRCRAATWRRFQLSPSERGILANQVATSGFHSLEFQKGSFKYCFF